MSKGKSTKANLPHAAPPRAGIELPQVDSFPTSRWVGPVLAEAPQVWRYAAVIAVVLVVAVLRAALTPVLGNEAPLLPFLIAVFASAYLSGRGPAVLALVLVPLVATAWFTGFIHGTHSGQWGAHVALFTIVGVLVIQAMHELQRAYRLQTQALASERATAHTLKDTQASLTLALKAGRSGTFDWEVREDRLRWSDETLALHGIQAREFAGMQAAWLSRVKSEDRPQVSASVERAFRGREFDAEYRVEPSEAGVSRWIQARGEVVFDSQHRPVRLRGIHLDITERKLAEAALRASEGRMRLLAEHLPVLLGYVDRDEIFRFANRAYLDWFGRDPCDPPTPMREVFGEALYQERLPHVRAALRGEVVHFASITHHRTLGPRACESTYVPELGCEGTVRGFYVMAQDVTEREDAERALRERERLLKLVYDNASDGLALLAIEGPMQFRFLSINEAFLRLSGYTRQQVQGRLIEEALPDATVEVTRAKLAEAVQLRQALDYRESADLPAGARLTDVTLVPIADGAATITHVLAARRDVTAKYHAEEALREADRRKDEFLAMLAHELRNPLAPIRNVAHLLASEALDTRTIRRSSELLQRQASQLARLVDDLLDVARITRGTIELKKEVVSLERLVETALESVQPLFDVKQQTVRIMRAPEAVFVEADAVRLCQIFSNLLTNAAKYSPDRTEITVTIEASADDAYVTVQDHGRGIDPEMLPRIFDLFMQGDRSLDRREGGLGIGLTIVKHLVEMHGGRITAHSAGLARGSSFRVQLPWARSTEPLPLNTATAPHPAHSRRILIVEDNEDAAESLLMLLQMEGHEVKVEHEGSAALALLEEFPAEIAFIDIGLPGMDGYSLAQAIRARFGTRVLRLYAMTGYGRLEDRALALAAGFDEHLTKPVDTERLTLLLRAENVPVKG